jgi:hypothetical protein
LFGGRFSFGISVSPLSCSFASEDEKFAQT